MEKRIARPRKVIHSEKLDVLTRAKKDFAVRPACFENDKWSKMRVTKQKEHKEISDKKQMIRDLSTGVKGINFPVEEMAKVIRSWINKD